MDATRCILRYVKSSLQYGLFYEAGCSIQVHGYTDANYIGSISNRRSTSGFVFCLGSATINWNIKKQLIVALLSTETEYKGVAMAACERAWL